MRKTHSLKGRKVFYSVYENISETLVPPNMITRHTRACVTLQPTFLECGFSVLWPPGSAEEHPALFNTPPNSSLCSIRQPGTSLNPSLLALSNRTSVCVLNRFCKILLIQLFFSPLIWTGDNTEQPLTLIAALQTATPFLSTRCKQQRFKKAFVSASTTFS